MTVNTNFVFLYIYSTYTRWETLQVLDLNHKGYNTKDAQTLGAKLLNLKLKATNKCELNIKSAAGYLIVAIS